MDFRLIEIPRIAFDRAKPTRWKVRYGGGGEVAFQLPTYKAIVEAHPRIQGSHQVRGLVEHHAFGDFIQSLKKHTLDCVPELGTMNYRDSFGQLTVFESTLFFNSNGSVTHLSNGNYVLTPLVKIDGIWATEYSWGYRVDVTQIKLHEECEPSLPPPPDMKVYVDGKPLLFIDDD